MNMFTLDMLMLENRLAVATPNDMSGSHATADLCSVHTEHKRRVECRLSSQGADFLWVLCRWMTSSLTTSSRLLCRRNKHLARQTASSIS